MAEASLIALDEGDNEGFVANFADELRKAMSEENFQELRTTLQETSGLFLSLTGPQLVKASTPDVVGYVYTCKIEKEEVMLIHYYKVGGDRVEGYFVNSPNLRKISQQVQIFLGGLEYRASAQT